jgi:hypothetical protein
LFTGGQHPFRHREGQGMDPLYHAVRDWLSQDIPFFQHATVMADPDLVSFLRSVLRWNASERPDTTSLLQHPLVKPCTPACSAFPLC